jgi:metallo-beta-lactamase family protein
MDLAKIIDETLGNGGNVIIPSFAVGRAQELLYFIREIKEKNLVKSVPDFPVYVDSPLAEQATRIYDGDLRGYADEEAVAIISKGFKPIDFPNLFVTESTEESKALNEDRVPKIIISSSGMCNAGRIRHHLKHNLWRKECSIVFVGYQANGTLGRMILEGLEKVKLFGEEIAVAAKIVNFRGLSAHADRTGLLKWIHSYSPKPQKVFIIHGEASVCGIFADTLKSEGYDAFVPNFQMTYDLLGNSIVDEGIQLAAPEQHLPLRAQATPLRTINNEAKRGKIVSRNYIRLLEASEMLLATIKRNQSLSNRDVSKITDQIRSLTDKLDR